MSKRAKFWFCAGWFQFFVLSGAVVGFACTGSGWGLACIILAYSTFYNLEQVTYKYYPD